MADEAKLISGGKFIGGLLRLGIVDSKTRKVTITAEVGEVILLEVERYGDDRLLRLLDDGDVLECVDVQEAIAR